MIVVTQSSKPYLYSQSDNAKNSVNNVVEKLESIVKHSNNHKTNIYWSVTLTRTKGSFKCIYFPNFNTSDPVQMDLEGIIHCNKVCQVGSNNTSQLSKK